MSKNKELLVDFVKYCVENPEQRFWQALRNWSGFSFVGVANSIKALQPGGEIKPIYHDTFYFEGKDK